MAARIHILSNRDYRIGDVICQRLQNAEQTQIAVAFLKYSGINVIDRSLRQCLDDGGSVELIAGLDFKTTDPKSIRYFLDLGKKYPKTRFYCFGDRGQNKTDIIFHPKIYLFSKGQEKTSIVGSTNLTRGGLTDNFEVNTIFTEEKNPVYYAQLQAIYDSVKYADSIFSPDEEYLQRYSDVYGAFSKNDDKASQDPGLQKDIREIQEKEGQLPGTVPSLKSLVIGAMRDAQQESKQDFVPLRMIYERVEKAIAGDENLKERFKMDTLHATIRGEINHHEASNTGSRSLRLFARSKEKQGCYALTDSGKNYQGR